MPMYEYRCKECGKTYEKLRRLQDADRDLECPYCEAKDVERLISAFAMTGGCGSGAVRGRFT